MGISVPKTYHTMRFMARVDRLRENGGMFVMSHQNIMDDPAIRTALDTYLPTVTSARIGVADLQDRIAAATSQQVSVLFKGKLTWAMKHRGWTPVPVHRPRSYVRGA